MRILKTNTAIKICVGPLLDVTDGITPELTAVVASMLAEICYEKDEGSAVTRIAFTPAASASNNDMIPVASSVMGLYDLELTQANTNFLGRAKFAIIDTDVMLPYFEDWFVVSANVYDSLMGTDLLDTNTAQVLNTACHASTENGTQCVEVVRWGGADVAATAIAGTPKVDIAGYRGTAAHTETTAGLVPAELHQVLGQSVTCAAGITVGAFVGNATAALGVDAAGKVAVLDTQKVDVETIKTRAVTCAAGVTVLASVGAPAAPGAATGLTTVAAGGVKQAQTVDLTAGQTIAATVADKAGYSLSATGADLILKSSTFVVAIRDAINELATYGLTALNALLVTTGIKAATIPAATLAANQHVIVDSGTVTTCTTNTDMRGTDSAALASVCTEARLSELDAATGGKMANQVDIIQTDTTTDIPGTITTLQGNVTTIMADTDLLDDAIGGIVDIHTDVGTAITQATEANAHAHAIDLQTAKLVFTVANELDANVQSINDTALTGNGSALTPWGPV